jgi:hypothetical protein
MTNRIAAANTACKSQPDALREEMTHLPLTSKPRSFLLEEEEENGNGLAE